MRILVTGASGMLGEPLVETFGADCIVTGLSRHRPANASADWVEADIGKPRRDGAAIELEAI